MPREGDMDGGLLDGLHADACQGGRTFARMSAVTRPTLHEGPTWVTTTVLMKWCVDCGAANAEEVGSW